MRPPATLDPRAATAPGAPGAPGPTNAIATASAAGAPARPRPAPLETTVLDLRPLSPRALALTLARPRGFDFPATRLAAVSAGGEHRTLTIASGPERRHLEFATLRGPSRFKAALAGLRPGDTVGLKGPFGNFALDPGRPAVMLAGHVGIAPFKAMLEHALDAGLDLRGAVLHAHPAGDAPYREDVAALAARLPGMHAAWGGPEALGDAGRLAALVEAAAPGPGARAEPRYYVAGTPAEVLAASGALAALGVPRERVKVEMYFGYR